MNARDRLQAREIHTATLYLGGKRITAEDLLRDAIATAPAPSREMLVRSQPASPVSREEFEHERRARHEQYEEFRRMLQQARAQPVRGNDDDDPDDRVTVKRAAFKRGQRYFVAGKRVEAAQLQSIDGGKRFIVTRSGTVGEMLQYFADELDALHQAPKASEHAASEGTDSSAN